MTLVSCRAPLGTVPGVSPPPVHHRVVTDPVTGVPVLVKSATGDAGRARLAAEADLLRRLDHLAVVRPLSHRDDGHEAQLHLAWVGPHSLDTIAGLTPEGSAELVAGVAATVAGLHAHGLVHRAIRPEHVVMATDGTPVLTGLAHALPVGTSLDPPIDPALDPPIDTPVGSGTVATFADDVTALGMLLVRLVQPTDPGDLVPDARRWRRRRDAGTRGVLLTLADRATADDPDARPSAAVLAADLRTLVPPGSATPTRRPNGGPRPHRGRVVASATLVTLVGATVAAATWWVPGPARDGEPTAATTAGRPGPTSPDRHDRATGPAPSTVAPPSPSTTRPAPTTSPATPPPTTSAPATPCAPAAPPAADVDGDGCPDPLRIEGEHVSAGPTTWIVGRAGDRPVVGDWDCDGLATVALLRPATGEVFVFPTWSRPGSELTVEATSVVADAERIEASDPDGDGCAVLVAHRAGQPPVIVPVGSGR